MAVMAAAALSTVAHGESLRNGLTCPAQITSDQVKALGGSVGKNQTQDSPRLFALEKSDKGVEWKELERQVVAPAEGKRDLHFFTGAFGPRAKTEDGFPCAADRMIEMESDGRMGYFAVCSPASPPLDQIRQRPVVLDTVNYKVVSPHYSYEYYPNNQLLFKKLSVTEAGTSFLVSSDAEMLLHLDIKKFFTLNFTNESVESYLNNLQEGFVGSSANIAFFVKVLMFKVSIKMAALASFYDRSANIPIAVDVPVDARSNLNHGSGMLYSWKNDEAVIDRMANDEDLPSYDGAAILAGPEALAKIGQRYCKGEICTFRLKGHVRSLPYALNINVPRDVVALGFYPMFVGDTGKFKRDLKWDEAAVSEPRRVAMFFANSGLPKGQYRLDHWVRMGESPQEIANCPAKIQIGAVIDKNLAH